MLRLEQTESWGLDMQCPDPTTSSMHRQPSCRPNETTHVASANQTQPVPAIETLARVCLLLTCASRVMDALRRLAKCACADPAVLSAGTWSLHTRHPTSSWPSLATAPSTSTTTDPCAAVLAVPLTACCYSPRVLRPCYPCLYCAMTPAKPCAGGGVRAVCRIAAVMLHQ